MRWDTDQNKGLDVWQSSEYVSAQLEILKISGSSPITTAKDTKRESFFIKEGKIFQFDKINILRQ